MSDSLALLRGCDKRPRPWEPSAVRLSCFVTDSPSNQALPRTEEAYRLSNKGKRGKRTGKRSLSKKLIFEKRALGPTQSRDCVRCHGCIGLRGWHHTRAVTVTMSLRTIWLSKNHPPAGGGGVAT